MTSIERVKKAIQFTNPDKIPVWSRDNDKDIIFKGISQSKHTSNLLTMEEMKEKVPNFKGTIEQNEWGAIVGRVNPEAPPETIYPGFSWENFEDYIFPDLDAPYRYQEVKEKFDSTKGEKYNLGWFGGFYVSALYNSRSMEEFLVDVGLTPENITDFCRRYEPIQLKRLEEWKKAGAHGVMYGEDLGLQERLMMNPDTWRKIFKPFYKRFIEHGHKLGLDIFMHSCGYIKDIIPDLIEIKVDVLQLDQPTIFGIQNLAKDFGGKICFFCPVDIQNIMPTGNKQDIIENALLMCSELGKFNGGFMGKDYPQWEDIGIPEEWASWARDAFLQYEIP